MPKSAQEDLAPWQEDDTKNMVIPVRGETVRYYRTLPPNLSQYKVAKDSGLSRSYLSEIESGLKQPRRFAAEKIAEVLGVTVRDLVESPPEATG